MRNLRPRRTSRGGVVPGVVESTSIYRDSIALLDKEVPDWEIENHVESAVRRINKDPSSSGVSDAISLYGIDIVKKALGRLEADGVYVPKNFVSNEMVEVVNTSAYSYLDGSNVHFPEEVDFIVSLEHVTVTANLLVGAAQKHPLRLKNLLCSLKARTHSSEGVGIERLARNLLLGVVASEGAKFRRNVSSVNLLSSALLHRLPRLSGKQLTLIDDFPLNKVAIVSAVDGGKIEAHGKPVNVSTKRRVQVLTLALKGKREAEVKRSLGVSASTLRADVKSIERDAQAKIVSTSAINLEVEGKGEVEVKRSPGVSFNAVGAGVKSIQREAWAKNIPSLFI